MSNKEAYEKKMQAKMHEWKADIDKLKAQSKGKSADVQIEYNKKVKELEQKKDAAQSKLDDVQNASSDAWEDLRDGVKDAANDLGDSIKSAKKQFSKN